jgi:choice-of-anchor B domain-containing protein
MLRKISTVLLLLLYIPVAYAQNDRMNLTVLSHWNDTTLKHIDGDQIWSDITGWKDTVKNREYLIAGSTDSIYFFDITDPTRMILCDVESGRSRNAINRDYETYSHYVYCVSDRTSPLGALQIFDMQYLPDSVHKVYDDGTLGLNTHTIFIDTLNAKLYMCTNSVNMVGVSAMDVLSLRDPEKPTLMTRLVPPGGLFSKVHEVFVKNDTAYCSGENAGLFIYDMRDTANPVMIGSIQPPYPQNGYNHSSWLDSTGRYLMFTDENQGLGIKVFDVSTIGSPDFVTVFNSHSGALPHNAFWKGRFAYVSSYEDGVYIYDMKDVATMSFSNTPPIAGFYDTYPKNAPGIYNGFHGCWGVYPFLPSGVILASDISEGLFVLQPSANLPVYEPANNILQASVFPNPFTTQTSMRIRAAVQEQVSVTVYTLQGIAVSTQTATLNAGENTIELNNPGALSEGLYQLHISGTRSAMNKAILKIH